MPAGSQPKLAVPTTFPRGPVGGHQLFDFCLKLRFSELAICATTKATTRDFAILTVNRISISIRGCRDKEPMDLVLNTGFFSFFDTLNIMSNRPTCPRRPSAKLTADNAGELERSSHRCVVASSIFFTQRRPATSSASFLPDTTPPDSDNSPAPSLTPPKLAQTRTSCKRPQASHDSDGNNPSPFNEHNGTKKTKTNDVSTDFDGPGMDNDGVHDPHEESLNKTNPTADIKAFFKPLPRVPGQLKSRMSCTLCS